jgi:hypothetical protein
VQAFIDDATGYVWTFSCSKPDSATSTANLIRVKADLRSKLNMDVSVELHIVRLQSDSATVFTAGAVRKFCTETGTRQSFSAPYSQNQNGRVERFFRTMETLVSAMFIYSPLPIYLWPFAVSTMTHTHNRTIGTDHEHSPYELLIGSPPDVDRLRVWGCPAQAFLQREDHHKFGAKTHAGFNLGPNTETADGFHFYMPSKRAIRTTRNICMDELYRKRCEYYKMASELFTSPFPAPPPDNTLLDNQPIPFSPGTYTTEDDTVPPFVPSIPPVPQLVFQPPVPHTAGNTPHQPILPHAGAAPQLDRNINPATRRALLHSDSDFSDSHDSSQSNGTASDLNDSLGNTNAENKRTVPITTGNDRPEVAYVQHHVTQKDGTVLYEYKPNTSYNMTPSALEHRTNAQHTNPPYTVQKSRPTEYGPPENVDIIWNNAHDTGEVLSTRAGAPIEPLQKYLDDPRIARAENRDLKTTNNTYFAMFTSLAFTPVYKGHALFPHNPDPLTVVEPAHMHANDKYFSSLPTQSSMAPDIADDNALFAYLLNVNATSNSEGESTAYAFLDFILPSGSTPLTPAQALRSADRKHWRFAMDTEHQQLVDAVTWIKVNESDAKNIISGKWIFKIKKDKDGNIEKYKARWVARGFSQKQGVDFTEIFSPVIRYSSVRLLLALANANDLTIYGLDVANAFAQAPTDHELYVREPTGYDTYNEKGERQVCLLQKALYGCKQSSRMWHQTFTKFALQDGWTQFETDTCIFSRHTASGGVEYIGLYVDDIIYCTSSSTSYDRMFAQCNKHFKTTSQGEIHWILGMEVKRDRKTKTLSIDNSRAILNFLELYGMRDGKTVDTPMLPQWKYGEEPAITEPKRLTEYRSKISSMSYFAQCTRPDISLAVSKLASHLQNPNEHCFRAMNHLMHYLSGTPHLGIVYRFGKNNDLRLQIHSDDAPNEPSVKAYADASFGGENIVSAKSQSGFLIYLGGGLIDWSSHLQSIIALSSAESEQNCAHDTARSIIYYRQLLEEIGFQIDKTSTIFEDNEACIAQSKNPVNHKRSRHTLIRYHYLRHLTAANVVRLSYIHTSDQLADILTKPVPYNILYKLRPFIVSSTDIF